MGRRKIEIQPLPESQIRAKFKKRKSGLVKKAYELGTLCGAQVALIIFSKDGDEVIDKGYNATTVEIIQRYWRQVHSRRGQSRSGISQQQITASQVQQLQHNSDASTQGVTMNSQVQQDQFMNPQLQQDQFTNPQVQQDQYVSSQVQQDQFMNPQVQQDQYVSSQVQQDQFMNPQVQQDQFMNPQVQQDQYMNSQVQQDQYMNLLLQVQQDVSMYPLSQQGLYSNPQEVSTSTPTPTPGEPCMQRYVYVNPHEQQSIGAGISNSQMQQGGMQYNSYAETTLLDIDTSDYIQDVVEGNQQFHSQGHQTQFENQTYVRNNNQPSETGLYN